jgi:hypothetical protein
MSWTKQNENFYTHDQAPFSISYINGSWFLIDNRDQSKGIPFEDIYNNPVWSLNLGNQTILAAHFRGEAANTPSTPAHSFKTDIDTGMYRISDGKVGFSSNGLRVGEFGTGYGGFTGNIIQVLQTSIDTQLSTGSTSYVDITGLLVSITPKYTTSKILIRFKLNASNSSTSNLNAYQIVRDSTPIGNGTQGSRRACHSAVRGSVGDPNSSFIVSGEFLDSPSTILAITYKIQFLVDGGTGYINRDDTNGNSASYPTPLSSLTLLEVQQ